MRISLEKYEFPHGAWSCVIRFSSKAPRGFSKENLLHKFNDTCASSYGRQLNTAREPSLVVRFHALAIVSLTSLLPATSEARNWQWKAHFQTSARDYKSNYQTWSWIRSFSVCLFSREIEILIWLRERKETNVSAELFRWDGSIEQFFKTKKTRSVEKFFMRMLLKFWKVSCSLVKISCQRFDGERRGEWHVCPC
jgi:hypothetical protein